MLKIRFSRKGKKKQPLFRIIINRKTKDVWGDYLENLGNFNPRTKEAVLKVDRIKYWLSKGAEVSDTVWNLLVTKGVVEGKKRTVTKISKARLAKKAETEKKAATEKAAAEIKLAAEAKAKAPAEPVKEAPAEPAREEVKPETIKVAPAEPPKEKVKPETIKVVSAEPAKEEAKKE